MVPKYEELSVKNLYEDALNDPEVGSFLPDLAMNSNRLPERDFFFGILGTIKPDYLKQIINDAHKNHIRPLNGFPCLCEPFNDLILYDDLYHTIYLYL